MSNDSSNPSLDTEHSGTQSKVESVKFYHPIFAIAIVFAIYALGQAASLVISMLYPALYGKEGVVLTEFYRRSTEAQFFHIFFIELVLFACIFIALRVRKIRWEDIGLKMVKFKDFTYGVLGFGYYFPTVLLVSYLFTKLIPTFDVNQQQSVGFQYATGGELIYVFLALVVLPPLIEEILFRGFLYTQLAKAWSILPATLVTCIIFAAAHLSGGQTSSLLWIAGLDTFVLSLVLVYVRRKRNSLWPAIILHALKNGIAFVYLFLLPLR